MTIPSGDWGGGYVTDIPYLPGYLRQHSPVHLHCACLLGGVGGIETAPGEPLSYLDLGCGQGFAALALAASNPSWRVTGIDFNPAHVAAARALAAEAGVKGARFIEADLATLAESPLAGEIPEADVAVLHGLWSWVGDGVRAGILRLLSSKVRAGGIVCISYNALPAWGGALGMQRLLREAGTRLATRSDRQAAAGFEVLRALFEANAQQLSGTFVRSLIEDAEEHPPAYLAHEYMNSCWQPFFHADVAAALAAAKLDWVASAQLLENFSPLMLGEEARKVLDRFDEPLLRELVKDMCLSRTLRQDVFVRGPRRLAVAERDRALGEVMLSLLCEEKEFVWEIEVPAGKAAIERGFFGPIVAALAREPKRVRELLALPGLPRRDPAGEVPDGAAGPAPGGASQAGDPRAAEVVGILVGTGQALPISAPPCAPEPQVGRLNEAAARRFARFDNLRSAMALATSGSGTPFPCPMVELFVAGGLREDEKPDPALWAQTLAPGSSPEERQRLAGVFERILAERVPIWRRFGALARGSVL